MISAQSYFQRVRGSSHQTHLWGQSWFCPGFSPWVCTVRFSPSPFQFSFYTSSVTTFALLPSSQGSRSPHPELVNSVDTAVFAVLAVQVCLVYWKKARAYLCSLALDSFYPVTLCFKHTLFHLHMMVTGEPCSPFFLGVYPCCGCWVHILCLISHQDLNSGPAVALPPAESLHLETSLPWLPGCFLFLIYGCLKASWSASKCFLLAWRKEDTWRTLKVLWTLKVSCS